MNDFLSSGYWNQRYEEGKTGWDIGAPSQPLKTYFDQLKDYSISILIPGAGNAYEAVYLQNLGFTNVHILDFAPAVIEQFKKMHPDFLNDHIHCENFFEHKGQYDLIIEQTFFCALDPKLRVQYVDKMLSLLKPGGKLVGLLFNKEMNDGPPFGGDVNEYMNLFAPKFSEVQIEGSYNSIDPRSGSEVFIKLTK